MKIRPIGTELERERILGTAIAQLYIAAQHISLECSDAACDLIYEQDSIVKRAFDIEMERDGRYGVRAFSTTAIITK